MVMRGTYLSPFLQVENQRILYNGCVSVKENYFSKTVTFSGFDNNIPLKKDGDLNFWVDSKAYNFVENIHQFWLLAIVDLIIGKFEYPAN